MLLQLENISIFEIWIGTLILLLLRYFFIAGLAWLVFWKLFPRNFAQRKIQDKLTPPEKIRMEIGYSLSTFVIFSFTGVGIFIADQNNIFEIYQERSLYGISYYVFSFFAIIFLHDTYFYWMHRLVHLQPIYRIVHKVHHLSSNPSPFASFSFHPYEAVFEAAILPLALFIMPLHYSVIIFFLFFMTLLNVEGHLGYEILPRWFISSRWTFWNNTSTHHNMHHKYINCNYGLYFNIWDRLMGTNHPDYFQTFEKLAQNKLYKNT